MIATLTRQHRQLAPVLFARPLAKRNETKTDRAHNRDSLTRHDPPAYRHPETLLPMPRARRSQRRRLPPWRDRASPVARRTRRATRAGPGRDPGGPGGPEARAAGAAVSGCFQLWGLVENCYLQAPRDALEAPWGGSGDWLSFRRERPRGALGGDALGTSTMMVHVSLVQPNKCAILTCDNGYYSK